MKIKNIKTRRENLPNEEIKLRFRYGMVLYDHSKLAKIIPFYNKEIVHVSNSEELLDELYKKQYYPRFERVLVGETKDILK